MLSSVKGTGGALWFQSELKEGTRFVFWIPVAEEIEEKDEPEQIIHEMSLRSVLVEDDPEVAKVLTQMLQGLNIVVEHYQASDEVMRMIDDKSMPDVDLGILDVRLGGIDGIELGHHLFNKRQFLLTTKTLSQELNLG